jgi:hypothetical protein
MVTRWVGNPDEPENVREACGRPAKFTLTADASPHVSVFVCGRHARWSPSMQSFMPVHIVPLERRHG